MGWGSFRSRLAASVERRALWALVAVYAIVLIRTAWLDDDCFISLRVVDNFVNGYGLRWNVAERVQAYSHPLWLFLISGFYVLTHEAFFTTVLVSVGVSLLTLVLYVTRAAGSNGAAVVVLGALILSRSYVDYSTSGLENPLTHLLIVLFFLALGSYTGQGRRFFLLSILTALLILTRDDLALLVLPTWIAAYGHVPKLRGALWGAVGMSPLVLWKAFSLIYYGSLVPNTAYAKLHTGIPEGDLVAQGLRYFFNQALVDPLSLAAIALAFLSMLPRGGRRHGALCLGVFLYLCYVVAIGGCFMSERLFAAPFLVSVLILGQRFPHLDLKATLGALIAVCALGLIVPRCLALVSGGARNTHGINDERRFYYPANGLLPNLERSEFHPKHGFVRLGLAVKDRTGVFAITASGLAGYFAGPKAHLVDVYALCDPLLARLPSRRNARIGHFERMLPEGYLETLASGEDHFRDVNLGEYYRAIQTIARGPFWSAERWRAIGRLHSGRLERLIDKDFYARGYVLRTSIDTLFKPDSYLLPFDRTLLSPRFGLEVTLELPEHAKFLDVSVERGRSYTFEFFRAGTKVGQAASSLPDRKNDVLVRLMVEVPEAAREAGYDRIRVRGGGGSGGSIGHLRVAPRYTVDVTAEELSRPFENGTFWLAPGTIELLPNAPLHVRLGAIRHSTSVGLSLDHNDTYGLTFFRGGSRIDGLTVRPPAIDGGGLSNLVVHVPPGAVEAGYDEITVQVMGGDPFVSIGQLTLLE